MRRGLVSWNSLGIPHSPNSLNIGKHTHRSRQPTHTTEPYLTCSSSALSLQRPACAGFEARAISQHAWPFH